MKTIADRTAKMAAKVRALQSGAEDTARATNSQTMTAAAAALALVAHILETDESAKTAAALRAARTESLADVAAATHITVKRMNALENGAVEPDAVETWELAEYYRQRGLHLIPLERSKQCGQRRNKGELCERAAEVLLRALYDTSLELPALPLDPDIEPLLKLAET